jgi:Zn-dependent alcohol dehydrogenase
VAANTGEAAAVLRDLTRGVMADSVVVSPSLISGEDVQAALSLTRKGGTCVLTGMTKQTTNSVALNLQEFILWNKSIVGTVYGSCNPRVDVARFARLYEAGLLQLDEMITRRYALDDINDGYRDLRNGEIIRGVIDFGLNS